MTRYRYAVAALLAIGLGAPAAQACTWYPPVDLSRAHMADLIVEGRVADYSATSFDRAVLRLENVKAIKGDASGTIDIAIVTDGPVDHFRRERGTKVIVGAADPSSQAERFAERAGGLPMVHVPICTSPFIIPANRKNRDDIRTSIRGHDVSGDPAP